MHFSISVAGNLFDGYTLVLPYPEWKRDGDGGAPDMTHADRIAAFAAYTAENGPQAYYLEKHYGESGEENGYDPYLWIRAADEPAEDTWYQIDLEAAVNWTEQHAPSEYDVVPDRKITKKVIDAAIAEFCKDTSWKHVYDHAPDDAKRRLGLTFLKSSKHELVAANKEEFDDELESVSDALGVADWGYLIATIHETGGGVLALEIQEYEKRIAFARERVALKGVRAAPLLRELQQAHADWQMGQLDAEVYRIRAQNLAATMERLKAIQHAPQRIYRAFQKIYKADMPPSM